MPNPRDKYLTSSQLNAIKKQYQETREETFTNLKQGNQEKSNLKRTKTYTNSSDLECLGNNTPAPYNTQSDSCDKPTSVDIQLAIAEGDLEGIPQYIINNVTFEERINNLLFIDCDEQQNQSVDTQLGSQLQNQQTEQKTASEQYKGISHTIHYT